MTAATPSIVVLSAVSSSGSASVTIDASARARPAATASRTDFARMPAESQTARRRVALARCGYVVGPCGPPRPFQPGTAVALGSGQLNGIASPAFWLPSNGGHACETLSGTERLNVGA